MKNGLSRRQWMVSAPGATLAAAAIARAGGSNSVSENSVHPEFPSHDPATVRELVAVSHVNLSRVRELVEASPALAKASWDWGFGDWESGLGAASHMGRRDIAELLISRGARPNVFTLAMMDKVDAVRAYVEAIPGLQRIPGPHGITLLRHAKIGYSRNKGENTGRVVEYLESLGDADRTAESRDVTEEQKKAYVGRYSFGAGPDDAFDVLLNSKGKLSIKRGDRFARVLNRVEENGFAPGGAPDVRVRFKVMDGRVVSLAIHDPVPLVTAVRSN